MGSPAEDGLKADHTRAQSGSPDSWQLAAGSQGLGHGVRDSDGVRDSGREVATGSLRAGTATTDATRGSPNGKRRRDHRQRTQQVHSTAYLLDKP
jgi:hypothetical protein